jgi:DNA-binding GntR family transcriptional regulator
MPLENAETGSDRIERRTLHDEVVTRVRDMIIEGELATGSRVNESELGRRLGVSRTPLREALKTLAGEGLIELVPARGAVVRRFGLDDVRHMLETIKALEGYAATVGVGRASDNEIRAILDQHDHMLKLYAARDRLSYYKLNQAIHTAIVALAHNPSLLELHTTMQSRLKRIRYIGNSAPEKWADAVAEHERMSAALAARDGPALAAIMAEHMDKTLERVRDVV